MVILILNIKETNKAQKLVIIPNLQNLFMVNQDLKTNQQFFTAMIQVKKEKYRSETWVREELEELEHPDRKLQGYEYRQAEAMLQDSYQPDQIICRDEERLRISNFIKSALEKHESRQSLYISGVPGIGKTLCVKTLMQTFLKEELSKYGQFKYVYLNAMKLSKANEVYKNLYIELTSHKERKVKMEAAMYSLDDLFRKGVEPEKYKNLSKMMKIVVIDEIDYLMTKDQDILYNLFDWTQSKTSRLAIIAISNTLNFPEALKAKIMSRIGNNRLAFVQYRSDQISRILKQRVEKTGIFDEKAIDLISKKIVKSTTDIRKSLAILRDSLYYHAQQNDSNYLVGKVTYSSLDKACENILKDPFTDFYKTMPLVHKKVLAILVNHFRREPYSMCLRSLCTQSKTEQYKLDEANTKETVLQLSDMGVIEVVYSKNYNSRYDQKMRNLEDLHINLNIAIDKVRMAINEDTTVGLKVD